MSLGVLLLIILILILCGGVRADMGTAVNGPVGLLLVVILILVLLGRL